MTYCLRVADLPTTERPRERLQEMGAQHLSTAELLAILLGTGQGPGKLSAVGLGGHLLQVLGANQREPLAVMRSVNLYELTQVSGVGVAKACSILAAVELGKRVFQSRPSDRQIVDDPAIAAAILSNDLMWQVQEHFAILLLDVKHRHLGTQIITIGTATETLAHPRDIFREVIRQGATRVIVAHNHPSGSTEPSAADMALTGQLLQGARLLDIPLLDHLILGGGTFCSLRQTTSLWEDFPQGD